MKKLSFLATLLASCLLTSAGAAAQAPAYQNPQLLIETGELSSMLSQPALCLLDARLPAEYRQGHLPGAVNLPAPATDDLEANRHGYPIPPRWAQELFWAAGVNNTSRVVVYDDQGNRFAARVFYVLEFFGHPHVQVLNGGIGKWEAEGRPLVDDVPVHRPGDFKPMPHSDLLATSDWVREHLKDRDVRFVDARPAAQYTGQEVHSTRGGHIPGAVSLEWTRVISGGDVKTFLPAAQLADLFASAQIQPRQQIVTYCQIGIQASAVYLALRLMGFEHVRMYDGSWQDWSATPDFPVEK